MNTKYEKPKITISIDVDRNEDQNSVGFLNDIGGEVGSSEGDLPGILPDD